MRLVTEPRLSASSRASLSVFTTLARATAERLAADCYADLAEPFVSSLVCLRNVAADAVAEIPDERAFFLAHAVGLPAALQLASTISALFSYPTPEEVAVVLDILDVLDAALAMPSSVLAPLG